MRSLTRLSAVLLSLGLAALACSNFSPAPTPVPTPPPAPTLAPLPTLPPGASVSEDQSLISLYQRVSPSVAFIQVQYQDPTQGLSEKLGSGFVYDTQGHIVTNNHVIDQATAIEVDFPSGLKTHGKVIGGDVVADVAVIQIEASGANLTPVPLADSDKVQVGERAIVIGNPFGLADSMSLGIVSALSRDWPSQAAAPGGGSFSAPDIIQTDAAINPGNSGGPLLNAAGEVIGISMGLETANSTASGIASNSGVGFAVASNTIKLIVPYLIKDGKFVYPYLGLSGMPELSLFTQEELKLPQSSGVYVVGVTTGGPSDKAGIKADSAAANATKFVGDGDLVVAIDGHETRVFDDLMSYLVNHTRPGQTVTLTLYRNGKKMDVPVTLGERPQQ
jgi:S1-C subfamily serine protease